MAYGELYLEPEIIAENRGRNLLTGRFMKGNEPYNKGLTWDEYVGKRAQKRMKRGWKNLDKYRPATRSEKSGRSRKPIIAINDQGKWVYYPDGHVASDSLGIHRSNIYRCCRDNQARRADTRTGIVNTDHGCRGIRFYFESDNIWMKKIKEN